MSVLLDAGALLAVERGNRAVLANLEIARRAGDLLRTHAAVLGQVWRGGDGRQVPLVRFLRSVDVRGLDADLGRAAGVLLGAAEMADVVDAALIAMADDGDRILTSDPDDLQRLATHHGRRITIRPC